MAGYIGSKSSVTQVDGYSEAEADAEFVNDPNGAITVSGSNVGIGTSSPSADLDIKRTAGDNNDILRVGSTDNFYHGFARSNTTGALSIQGNQTNYNNILLAPTSGNVGIGTSSPSSSYKVTIDGDASMIRMNHTGAGGNGTLDLGVNSTIATIIANYSTTAIPLRFLTGAQERMRIDSSGNLLVGNTSFAHENTGAMLASNGRVYSTVDGNFTFTANRLSSDGEIIRIQKDTTTVGSVGTNAGDLTIGTGDTGFRFNDGGNSIIPHNTSTNNPVDNSLDLGQSGYRWDDIYATNGTIQTSDFNEKQDIASLTATEMLVGKRISALFKTFRWKDSVTEKGDNARTHTGVIAQDVQAAFTAEGLDAGDYALFISSTWWEHDVDVPAVEAVEAVEAVTEATTDEDGNEVVTVITEAVEAVEAKDAYTRTDTYDTEAEAPEGATERTRLGIRYPELLSFVAAYNEQRFASIEARLTALEA